MSDDGECVHGLGDPAWCTLCNGREARERAEAKRIVSTFTAQFPGTYCAWCSDRIEVGDVMQRTGDGSYVCGDHP